MVRIGIALVVLYAAIGWIINQIGSTISGGKFVTSGTDPRRLEIMQKWYSYAASYRIIPDSYIIIFISTLFLFASIGLILRSKRPSIKVFGLISERVFSIIYGFGLSIIGLQVCTYMLAVCYAQIFLYPEIVLTLFIRDALISIVYIGIMLLCSKAAFDIFQSTAIRGSVLSWKIIKSLKLNMDLAIGLPSSFTEKGGILVVSDLHLTTPDKLTLEDGRSSEKSLSFLADCIENIKPKLIICCGDSTDVGDYASWELLSSFVKDSGVPFICAPGNHDYHFKKMDRTVISGLNYLLELFLFSYSEGNSYAKADVLKGINLASTVPINAFPVLVKDDGWGADVLILDSNQRVSNSPITNAIGLVGKEQLSIAQNLIASQRDSTKPLIILVHHHISPPKSIGRAARVFLCCLDADDVFNFAIRNAPAIILHGHLHMPYVRSGQVDIVSCGSALFSAKGPYEDFFTGKRSAFVLSISSDTMKIGMYTKDS